MYKGAWKLSDLKSVQQNGYKVFSCFACGGGSSMGYKLAGFDVIGALEIDPSMMKLYQLNLRPEYSYMMDIREFNKLADHDLPRELFELDILDGSPPCSSFSIAGAREGKWGKSTKFREGQKAQILDDLFFHFIDTAKRLKPKIVIAENVRGLVVGKAKGYIKQIRQRFDDIGYDLQLFLLNSANMGMPQARERTFFIARKRDLKLKAVSLGFNEPPISVTTAFEGVRITKFANDEHFTQLTQNTHLLWQKTKPGNNLASVHPNGSRFNEKKLHPNRPAPTLTTHCLPMHWNEPRRITLAEAIRLQTFPDDYKFAHLNGFYTLGMAVPPLMMQKIAHKVKTQLLDKMN